MGRKADQDDRWPAKGVAAEGDPEAGLVDLVIAVAENDRTLDENGRLLLLSVLTGDEELEAGLIGGTRTSARPRQPDADRSLTAAGAFLKSISVSGFPRHRPQRGPRPPPNTRPRGSGGSQRVGEVDVQRGS